ncbi:MAG TPA: ATP-dependent helicase, partial [Candidatus Peregrinibacteria bacterium]|nr:ATP-dependent helicase [Candidatus Peregrinibacteria bacterium]
MPKVKTLKSPKPKKKEICRPALLEQKDFNRAQLEAIQYSKGPLLVIAGAGTGKTRVITERILWLIQDKICEPEEILALTFTEKATEEMQERVDLALPIGHPELMIKTFHAFCDHILREYGLEIGLDPGYRILTEIESWLFLRKNLFKLDLKYYRPLGNPTKFINSLIRYFSRLQDENIDPEKYRDFAKKMPEGTEEEKLEKERNLELVSAYRQYQELKAKEGVMDFGDLHFYVLKLLKGRPNILEKLSEQYKYILVDEFQDTNLAQNEFVELLAEKYRNLTVVGDDDQSIYRFRGASTANIIRFTQKFPDAKKIVLIENYRSSQNILDLAYEVIQGNNPNRLEVSEKLDKKIRSNQDSPGVIEVFHTPDGFKEVEEVVKKIQELIKKEKYQFSDFAILARANSQTDPFIYELQSHGIPYQYINAKGLYEREEVKDLLAVLRVLKSTYDATPLFRLLKMKVFEIPMRDILMILNFSRSKNTSLWRILNLVVEEKLT